ncbi:mitochondrial 2-oxoglutarate/malate carrier protein isoform X1 [Corapipo altera]|uniref:mitochondrial 2-oxoglutarate/malate carrier protein isoform X1 n=1 Tax=Corapipo altera TaxID=415028 RepID=UPI000FD6B4F7|nr:mitochondrial 2-oxoglutarate/malate carrier protein isoform X1 [Corapipo altera]
MPRGASGCLHKVWAPQNPLSSPNTPKPPQNLPASLGLFPAPPVRASPFSGCPIFGVCSPRLSAGLLRQATYTTTRLGIYSVLLERFGGPDGTPPPFLAKAAMGMTAGAAGAFVGTPAEVALIRMTADGRLPPGERRGYRNVFDALVRMAREEGVLTLWRGCIPTMARAVVVNAAQLASYSQSKQFLLDSGHFRDDILCHFCASMISGLVTTAASMPVDIVKTRIQNMRTIDGKPEYRNGLDVLVKVVRYEGFFSLWKGFTPYYARLGPHTVLTFIFLEQMNKWYQRLFLSA